MKAKSKRDDFGSNMHLQIGLEKLRHYRDSGNREDLENASNQFNAAVVNEPKSIGPRYFWSIAQDLLGDSNAAIEGLKWVSDNKPPYQEEVFYNMGVAHFHKYHLSDLHEASRLFQKVHASRHSNKGLRILALASLAQVKAQLMIRRSEHNPTDIELDALQREVARLTAVVASELHQLGTIPQHQRREIIWRADNASGLSHMFASDYVSNIPVNMRLEMLEEAWGKFQSANTISPNNWAVLCNLGSTRMRQAYWLGESEPELAKAKFTEAEQLLLTVDQIRPRYVFARYELGRVFRLSSRFPLAIRQFEECLSVPAEKRDVGDKTLERELNRSRNEDTSFP